MMLRDARGKVAISSLGYVDRSSLWVCGAGDGVPGAVPIGDARYLTLYPGDRGCFSVVHHHEADRVDVTVHCFERPAERLAHAELRRGTEGRVDGDRAVWANVQTHYVAWLTDDEASDFALIRVMPQDGRVESQRFAWFTDRCYDKAFQGVIRVTEVPGDRRVIVAVGRDSRPVLYDPVARRKVGSIRLCGRGGNPAPVFRRGADELWVDDYDTLVVLKPGSWRRLRSRHLQPAAGTTLQFIGQFSFDIGEARCLVARPLSGDVIALDPPTLATVARCRFDARPIEAAALEDGTIVARDWQTGALLRGELAPS